MFFFDDFDWPFGTRYYRRPRLLSSLLFDDDFDFFPRRRARDDHEDEETEQRNQVSDICTTSFSYIDKNGVEHMKKETIDNVTGKKSSVETKRIKDKSITIQKETDKNGKEVIHETRTNLNDSDFDSFTKEWEKLMNESKSQKAIEHKETEEKKKE